MATILGEELKIKNPQSSSDKIDPVKSRKAGISPEAELFNRVDQILEYSKRAAEAAEKTRKYIFWNTVIQIGMVVLPLIGLLIAIPLMLKTLSSAYEGLL